MSLLVKGGSLVVDGSSLVETDDPSNCRCCGEDTTPPTPPGCKSCGNCCFSDQSTISLSLATGSREDSNQYYQDVVDAINALSTSSIPYFGINGQGEPFWQMSGSNFSLEGESDPHYIRLTVAYDCSGDVWTITAECRNSKTDSSGPNLFLGSDGPNSTSDCCGATIANADHSNNPGSPNTTWTGDTTITINYNNCCKDSVGNCRAGIEGDCTVDCDGDGNADGVNRCCVECGSCEFSCESEISAGEIYRTGCGYGDPSDSTTECSNNPMYLLYPDFAEKIVWTSPLTFDNFGGNVLTWSGAAARYWEPLSGPECGTTIPLGNPSSITLKVYYDCANNRWGYQAGSSSTLWSDVFVALVDNGCSGLNTQNAQICYNDGTIYWSLTDIYITGSFSLANNDCGGGP